MKKIILSVCAAVSIISLSAVAIAAEKVEITDAIKKGIISITVYGKANGELVQIVAKRLSPAPIIITFNEGRTDIAGEVSILVKSDTIIDLSSKYEGVIYLKQTGADRLTRGPVTINSESFK